MSLYGLARPFLSLVSPETAHDLAIQALRSGLVRGDNAPDAPELATTVWGLRFSNPLGLAAGFDKDALVIDAALDLGFGFVEAGTVTPRPQPGNSGKRLFRLDADEAVINRFGFNSRGLDAFVQQLKSRQRDCVKGIVAANVGKNRESEDAAADYARGVEAVAPLVDYIVVNLSSPNTPGLRALQAREMIEALLAQVIAARSRAFGDAKAPPLLAKVGPDLTDEQVADIAQVALRIGVDGLIVGNTTVDRPAGLKSADRNAEGGLSGRPLFAKATACLHAMYRATGGAIPIIGCGGVASGADAYAKIRAGASLVQLYSALVFQGPGMLGPLKRELAACLRRDGFATVAQAVGADHR
jgi:dihydroorotate dehydrogenase